MRATADTIGEVEDLALARSDRRDPAPQMPAKNRLEQTTQYSSHDET